MRYRKQQKLYFALKEYDFSFLPEEVDYTIEAWNEGKSLKEIYTFIFRKINRCRALEEVFLLVFDLASNGLIEAREGGIFGGER